MRYNRLPFIHCLHEQLQLRPDYHRDSCAHAGSMCSAQGHVNTTPTSPPPGELELGYSRAFTFTVEDWQAAGPAGQSRQYSLMIALRVVDGSAAMWVACRTAGLQGCRARERLPEQTEESAA